MNQWLMPYGYTPSSPVAAIVSMWYPQKYGWKRLCVPVPPKPCRMHRIVDRSIRSGALAIGAGVEIKTMPGYLPMGNNPDLRDILGENSRTLFGKDAFGRVPHRSGSTDMGDLSQIMPALHPYLAGATGSPHSDNWKLDDRSRVYTRLAKLMAMTALDLLWGKAEIAKSILKHHRPTFTREQYTAQLESWSKTDTYSTPK